MACILRSINFLLYTYVSVSLCTSGAATCSPLTFQLHYVIGWPKAPNSTSLAFAHEFLLGRRSRERRPVSTSSLLRDLLWRSLTRSLLVSRRLTSPARPRAPRNRPYDHPDSDLRNATRCPSGVEKCWSSVLGTYSNASGGLHVPAGTEGSGTPSPSVCNHTRATATFTPSGCWETTRVVFQAFYFTYLSLVKRY